MGSQENVNIIKAALEGLHNPEVYNQAWVDCNSLLNLSKETLEAHLQQWLWLPEGQAYKTASDEAYAIQLGHIEEYLVEKSVIYND